jgi:hypothetical protein
MAVVLVLNRKYRVSKLHNFLSMHWYRKLLMGQAWVFCSLQSAGIFGDSIGFLAAAGFSNKFLCLNPPVT